jgi:divalent metal cation (Fe/Co/Zn/Cd) transporter
MRTAVAVGFVGTVVVLGLVGIGFCLWAGYQYLELLVGSITASLICGLVLIVFASVLAWLTNRYIR